MTRLFPVAILAGGLATRLRPLTDAIPKALVDINGEPFVFHQLRLLRRAGIERVVLCVGYLGEQVAERVGDGAALGLDVTYSLDGPQLLGTAGAVKRALSLLGDSFFVVYGDSYLECDYAAVQKAFVESDKPALMTVYRNEGNWDTSNVEFAGGRILAYDKRQHTPRMRHIDYGLGVFHATAFDGVRAGETCDLAALYQALLAHDRLAACEVTQRFYEVGSPAGIDELRQHLKTGKPHQPETSR